MAKGAKAGSASAKKAAKAKSSGGRKQTVAQQALQKCRENLKHVPDEDKFVRILESTGRTLKQQIEHDISLRAAGNRSITFGPSYYSSRANDYASAGSVYASLKPDAGDESVVDLALMSAIMKIKKVIYIFIFILFFAVVPLSFLCVFGLQAMESLKERRPDRGPMLAYLRTTSRVSRKDLQGVLRWFSDLRLGEVEVQLPCAWAVAAWISRFL